MVNTHDRVPWFSDSSERGGGNVSICIDLESEVWRNGIAPTKAPQQRRKWNTHVELLDGLSPAFPTAQLSQRA